MDEKKFYTSRNGTWPIFQYVVQVGTHTDIVFLNDVTGSIGVHSDSGTHSFFYWWAKHGRVNDKLREFLVRTDAGYIKDKFSYGKIRWSDDQAMRDLKAYLEQKYGEDDLEWPGDLQELFYEKLDGNHSQDSFMRMCMESDTLKFEDLVENNFGRLSANPEFCEFYNRSWAILVQKWKGELQDELASNNTKNNQMGGLPS